MTAADNRLVISIRVNNLSHHPITVNHIPLFAVSRLLRKSRLIALSDHSVVAGTCRTLQVSFLASLTPLREKRASALNARNVKNVKCQGEFSEPPGS